MYKSPITTMTTEIHDNVAKRFAEHTENMVYEAVRTIDIHVDKDELIKALQYDRQQYEKGYYDGYSAGIEKGRQEALKDMQRYLKECDINE